MSNVLDLNPGHHVFQRELGEAVRNAVNGVTAKHKHTLNDIIGVLDKIKMDIYMEVMEDESFD